MFCDTFQNAEICKNVHPVVGIWQHHWNDTQRKKKKTQLLWPVICFHQQRSIRPQVVTTFQLEGCHDLWTVYGPQSDDDKKEEKKEEKDKEEEEKEKKEGEEEEGGGEGKEGQDKDTPPSITNGHAYLILSRDDSSMVSFFLCS